MSPILRNIAAVVAGILVGGGVNMAIVMISGTIIPPPEGADVTTTEGLKASMHLFETKHFVMPFLAHALGTLTGAFLTGMIAATFKVRFALGIGFFYLLGGAASVTMLPSPLWFSIIDLTLAYLPMGYLGGVTATRMA